MIDRLLTTRQAAIAIGVSEASIRRWCDQGQIPGERTAGGHRRIQLAALVEFARENNMRLSIEGAHGARETGGKRASADELRLRAYELAIQGDHAGLLHLVADIVGDSRHFVFALDEVLAPALHKIGALWATGAIDIYQEHRATETVFDVLARAASFLPAPDDDAATALCCALSPDIYSVPSRMCSLVATEAGFRTIQLGANTPASSVIKAITDLEPALVVLSVSFVESEDQCVESLQKIQKHCAAQNAAFALGGRALDHNVRRQVVADFFGDTMEHLSRFAHQVQRRAERPRGET